MKKYALALDLINDPELISQYEEFHRNGWPEIKKSILDSGIVNMEIYRTSNRLFMIMETQDDFSFEAKRQMDESNVRVMEWEALMWRFQQPLPWAEPGEKWLLMNKIFDLNYYQDDLQLS